MHLLLIDDDVRFGDLLSARLDAEGFRVDTANCLADGELDMQSAQYDAIILDRMLPDDDGLTWLHAQRLKGLTVPVLILSGRSEVVERIRGLDTGADDYLGKPVEASEVAARVRALLRRPREEFRTEISAGSLRLDPKSRVAHAGDELIDLSRREFEFLELVARRSPNGVRREAIESALYGFSAPVTSNAIDVLVSRVRRKLGDAGAPERIVTIREFGYRLDLF